MALIDCYECRKQISDTAPACPNCGAPAMRSFGHAKPIQKIKKVGPLRQIIIVVFWMFVGVSVIGYLGNMIGQKKEPVLKKQSVYPSSLATYEEINSQVGCKSSYSDEKKEDIFNARYHNKWMEWKGEIVLLEAGRASLNVDGVGTQDLSVRFEGESAGYDLKKGSTVTVRFLMKSAGGCFLPFSGEHAIVSGTREYREASDNRKSLENNERSLAEKTTSLSWAVQVGEFSTHEVHEQEISDLRKKIHELQYDFDTYVVAVDGVTRVFVGPISYADGFQVRDLLNAKLNIKGSIASYADSTKGINR